MAAFCCPVSLLDASQLNAQEQATREGFVLQTYSFLPKEVVGTLKNSQS